nr:MAG TPA: hypothetical protein [Caudoviricetes sp.]
MLGNEFIEHRHTLLQLLSTDSKVKFKVKELNERLAISE